METAEITDLPFIVFGVTLLLWIISAIVTLALWLSFRSAYKRILNSPARADEMPQVASYRQKVKADKKNTFKKLWWAWLVFGLCSAAFIACIAMEVIKNPESEEFGAWGIAAFWVLLAGVLVIVFAYMYLNGLGITKNYGNAVKYFTYAANQGNVDAMIELGNILAAGTAMRFLTAYLSQCTGVWTITGSERMRHRPIRLLVDALRSLGACIEYLGEEGFPPLRIEGKPLRGGDLTLSAGVSSQYISALLMIAPYMQEGLSLTLTGTMISKPYIAMTLAMMRHWGVGSRWEGNRIEVAPAAYKPLAFTVESDWSAASYWYEMVSLTPGAVVELPGLQRESVQGDARVADFYAALGVDTEFAADGVRLRHTGQTTTAPLLLDLTDQPDLAQTLVVTCALSQRPFRFTGLQSLKIKETDRIAALKCELAKLGYPIVDSDDSALSWDGRRADAAGHPAIDTYDDHRMAMAFAPAAMFFPGLEIRNPEVVSKSYPAFWDHLRQVGFDVRTLK